MSSYPSEIPMSQAQLLVQSGAWVFGSAVDARIGQAGMVWVDDWEASGTKQRVPTDFTLTNEVFAQLHTMLEERVDSCRIEYRPTTLREMQLGTKEGWVFKVGPALSDVALKSFGLVLALAGMSTAIFTPMGLATLGVGAAELARTIASHMEQLSDPIELATFQAVLSLHARHSVVDCAAFEAEDFKNAFGRLWPLEVDVIAACPQFKPEQMTHALHSMEQRRILALKHGRWTVRI